MRIGTIATAALGLAVATIVLPAVFDLVVALVVFGVGYAAGKGMFNKAAA